MAERFDSSIKKEMPKDGRRFGAYGIIVAQEGFVFVEKVGKGRGLEFSGGHGEPDDMSPEECWEREGIEETGIHIYPENMRLIEEPRVLESHISAVFLAQISRLPKTLKKFGDGGEKVYVIKQRNLKDVKIFPPHLRYLQLALNILDTRRCEK